MPQKTAPSVLSSPLEDAVDDYMSDVRARARRNTADLYDVALTKTLLPWAAEHGVTEVAQLTQKTMNAWVAHLRHDHLTPRGKPLSDASVDSYAKTVNTFLKWAAKEYGDVAGGVRARTPKLGRRVIDVLTRDEIMAMEEAATCERDALFIRLLADTGARLGEAMELRDQDVLAVDKRRHVVKLGGKTGERLVPITPALYRRLRKYIEKGRPRGYHGDYVFVSRRREAGQYRLPNRWSMGAVVKMAAQDAGIKKRVYPHLLRHSAITHQLRQGVNPIIAAQVAGHSSLEMIRTTYAHLSMTDTHAAIMAALTEDDR